MKTNPIIFKSKIRSALGVKGTSCRVINTRYMNDITKSIKLNIEEIKSKSSVNTSAKNTNRSTCISQNGSLSSFKTLNISNTANLYYCTNINKKPQMKDLAMSMTTISVNEPIKNINEQAKRIRGIIPIKRRIFALKSIKENIKENIDAYFHRSSSANIVPKEKQCAIKKLVNDIFSGKEDRGINIKRTREIEKPKLIKIKPKPKLSVQAFDSLQ